MRRQRSSTNRRRSHWSACPHDRDRFVGVALALRCLSGLLAVGLTSFRRCRRPGSQEYERTVTVLGVDQSQTILYPSSFSKPPNLFIEPTLPAKLAFYPVGEQTDAHFVIVNTTVNAGTGVPRQLEHPVEGERGGDVDAGRPRNFFQG